MLTVEAIEENLSLQIQEDDISLTMQIADSAPSGVVVSGAPGNILQTNPDGLYVRAVQYVQTIDDLAQIEAGSLKDGQPAQVVSTGRAGLFRWQSGDLSAEVAADPDRLVYVPSDDDPSGEAGAWVLVGPSYLARQYADATAAAAADAANEYTNEALAGISAGAPMFSDVAAGIAGTAEGDFFSTPSDDEAVALITYRHDPGPTAVEVARTPSRKYVDGAVEPVLFYEGSPVDRKGTLALGFISRLDGTEQSNTSWQRTDFIPLPDLTKGVIVSRVGTSIPSAGSAAGIAFYDGSQEYLGDSADGSGEFIDVASEFPGARFVRASFIRNEASSLSIDTQIMPEAVRGLTAVARFAETAVRSVSEDWLEEPAGDGYINLSGEVVFSGNWAYSQFIPLIPGGTYLYTGSGNTAVMANVASYDENKEFLGVEFANTGRVESEPITVNAHGARYVRVSSAKSADPAFVVTGEMIAGESVIGFDELREKVDQQPDASTPSMVPTYVYCLEGEPVYLYPRGIVADRSVDIAWNKPEGNNEFLVLTPTATESAVEITGIQGGSRLEIGSIPVLCSASPVSPAAPLNFICLGDSMTDGNAHSGISGAFPNELSRRLTGFGTDILGSGPAPLNLSNIVFRGTRGDQPVKHEGRGGWRASHYLNYAQVGSLTNAFWNPSTEEFDIDYYLEQNGFRDIDVADGVTSTGDNLVMIILLGWNDVYNSNAVTAAGYMRQLIDIILSKKPETRFIIPSLQPAPYTNMKAFNGVRYVSESEVFRSIREFALEYQGAISDVTGAEFLHLNHVFNANAGYNTADVPVAARGGETITVTPDHVHPNAVGYAMIADALYYNILWRFCQAT